MGPLRPPQIASVLEETQSQITRLSRVRDLCDEGDNPDRKQLALSELATFLAQLTHQELVTAVDAIIDYMLIPNTRQLEPIEVFPLLPLAGAHIAVDRAMDLLSLEPEVDLRVDMANEIIASLARTDAISSYVASQLMRYLERHETSLATRGYLVFHNIQRIFSDHEKAFTLQQISEFSDILLRVAVHAEYRWQFLHPLTTLAAISHKFGEKQWLDLFNLLAITVDDIACFEDVMEVIYLSSKGYQGQLARWGDFLIQATHHAMDHLESDRPLDYEFFYLLEDQLKYHSPPLDGLIEARVLRSLTGGLYVPENDDVHVALSCDGWEDLSYDRSHIPPAMVHLARLSQSPKTRQLLVQELIRTVETERVDLVKTECIKALSEIATIDPNCQLYIGRWSRLDNADLSVPGLTEALRTKLILESNISNIPSGAML